MNFGIFRQQNDSIAALYGTIVAQARVPIFYRAYGAADTVDGRLEMLMLHIFLFCRRVGSRGQPLCGLGQRVFDLFCCDMDGNLREMGIGDLAVPRHMERIGEAFYGRSAAYETALAAGDAPALAEALMRNVFSKHPQHLDGAKRLAAYMRAASNDLARQQDASLSRGLINFPNPETIHS
jgi:cytochrome b pre-mRNA-processing protein 3